MKATVWHGQRDVRVDEVADPAIKERLEGDRMDTHPATRRVG